MSVSFWNRLSGDGFNHGCGSVHTGYIVKRIIGENRDEVMG
jgi:hypothetical protein